MNSQQKLPERGAAKFMYVNQSFLNDIEQNKRPKVLINPNFMYVKPHFNKNFLVNQTVHVNPNRIKSLQQHCSILSSSSSSSSVLTTPTKFVRVAPIAAACEIVKAVTNAYNSSDKSSNGKVVISTRTKLIRVHSNNGKKIEAKRTSLHTKYKIVRRLSLKKQKIESPKDVKRLYSVKNRFKIVKRSAKKTSSLKLLSTNLNITKNICIKYNSRLKKINYITNIHKKTVKSNNKAKVTKLSPKGKERLLRIRGQKYKLDSNHRTLTLLTSEEDVKPNFKTVYLGGIPFKQKDKNVFIKANFNQRRVLLSQVKQRSINTLTNKMKKSNIPCPLYRKFGRCKGYEKGTCIRVHNPDQISLCPKFLQGNCTNNYCLLSHKVSAEKMPACKFYLDGGLCARDNCPYLHVKMSPKTEICKDFLEGFCKKAAECEKRHQYLCPDFEKCGKCLKGKCPYPHGSVVVVRKHNNLTSKLHKINKNHPVVVSKNDRKVETNLEKPNLRYYNELSKSDEKSLAKLSDNFEIDELDVAEENSLRKKRRPSVGDLPSFIPFLDEES